MITIDPKQVSVPELQSYLQGIIAPRPIAFASTIDASGNVNLTPFSFFNIFSSNPPIVIFSPARRVRDGSTKHSLENVQEVGEVVINIVNYAIVQQASLASTEYPKGINEFAKAGLTEVPSVLVKPPRVKESPASLECIVKQIIPLGEKGGAGNLVVCEVLLVHLKMDILNDENQVDPNKLDAVARMGGAWYCRAQGDAFQVYGRLQVTMRRLVWCAWRAMMLTAPRNGVKERGGRQMKWLIARRRFRGGCVGR
jgi:flavin reductase (DIM6/NTAB) family NADH-FMN oxidoreductase RutF